MKFIKSALVCLSGALALCGCSGVDALNFITPRSGYSVHKNIAYGSDARQQLDIYVPDKPAPGHPVVMFFYGGSWKGGSKNDYRFVGQAFAAQGFYTVIADYRVYPAFYFPAFMHDGADALVWTHSHIAEYGGNVNNLFVSGHSAGGHIAMLLTLDEEYLHAAGGKTSWIKGTIGIAGPYDFLPMTDPDVIAVFSKEDTAKSQPVTYVRPHLPPILLLQGDADTDVLPRNAHRLKAKLEANGDDVTTHFYPGVAHVGIILAVAHHFHYKAPTLQDLTDFVNSHSTKE